MITLVIFTYKRKKVLEKSLQSIDCRDVNQIILFNDDEKQKIIINQYDLNDSILNNIEIYNPIDFGFKGRAFRKPIYMNKSINLAKNEFILFSDDDGIFVKGSIYQHIKYLKKHVFCAGTIIRDRVFNRKSKSILQGTNYSFNRNFFKDIGGYDEAYVKSQGGGDVEFWYRIYNYTKTNNLPVALLLNACQYVRTKSTRKKKLADLDPKLYTKNKHNLVVNGPMYKWFPEIRNKSKWMNVISG